MGFFDFLKGPDINQGVKEYSVTDGAVLLDVRTPDEYRQGHIPGSKNVPLQSINKVAGVIDNKATPIFVHCLSGARRYVEKNDHKKSIRQMKFDLRQKGVSDDLVEMVFEDMEVDESAQILGLLRKKNYDPEEPDPAKRQKIYAFLARKGFSYDAINSAMKQWE